MPWHNVAAYFLGGMFLANFFPHFIAGMSGVRFYTPFATPPFRGLSSPVVNMLYALFNLAVAYALLVVVGSLELRECATRRRLGGRLRARVGLDRAVRDQTTGSSSP